MDKPFHLFVRKHSNGAHTAQVLTHPHLAAFSESLVEARTDVSRVIGKLLARGDLWDEETFWPELRKRRIDLVLRAVQHGRLIPVPLRLTVLTRPVGTPRSGKPAPGPIHVEIPRLGFSTTLADPNDLDAYVEEHVRHELFMAPLERLLALTYDAEESIETLIVTGRVKASIRQSIEAEHAQPTRKPLPEALGSAARRLNDEAASGVLAHAFQRDRELQRLTEQLQSRARPSVLLIGPSGVGKSALVCELVHRAQSAEKSDALHGLEVYSTSGNRIIAGMRYLGQWQQRLQAMLRELRSRRAVLHIESLSELLSTGGVESGLDLASMLLEAIQSADASIVCEATSEDVARAERTHPAFVHAMRPLILEPLSATHARLAAASVAHAIGRARKARFEDAAIDRALELSDRFGELSAQPGGAVELLRAALASSRTAPLPSKDGTVIAGSEVTGAFLARTGYPREVVDPRVKLDPEAVLRRLQERVEGQDEALALLRNVIVTLKTGLSDPARPLGAFLFVGPTGVGKTESALSLASYLFGDERRLVRFDMSEFAAPGSAARLLDTSGRGTSLARRVREQPFGVVLLDEIEKADSGVHDLLLQILGEGRLTDGWGRTVRFRNTVVILTSNLGADTAGRQLGFGSSTRELEQHYLSAAAHFFRPELVNRLDQIVPFRPLSQGSLETIARKALEAALSREGLSRRGARVRFDDAVVKRLAELGFDPRYGARPLKRAIERHAIGPLAQWLTSGRPVPRELVLSVAPDGELRVEPAR